MVHGDHPETDDSEVLHDDDHRKFQMLIGILNWVVTVGRLDVAYATMSLSRFSVSKVIRGRPFSLYVVCFLDGVHYGLRVS